VSLSRARKVSTNVSSLYHTDSHLREGGTVNAIRLHLRSQRYYNKFIRALARQIMRKITLSHRTRTPPKPKGLELLRRLPNELWDLVATHLDVLSAALLKASCGFMYNALTKVPRSGTCKLMHIQRANKQGANSKIKTVR
jgi:hypothetical protein